MISIAIIDDEIGTRTALGKIIQNYTKEFEVTGTADGVESGIQLLSQIKPQIVLLDINLNKGTAFDILKAIDRIDFKLIFVTAYDQFALQAIKFSAFDYLLKPINPDELISSLHKAKHEIESSANIQNIKTLIENFAQSPKPANKIILKTSEGIYIQQANEIMYCRADNNYTEIFTTNNGKIVASSTLKYFENMFEGHTFLRCHQSYLINTEHVKKYDKRAGGVLVMTDGSQIPVAIARKEHVLEVLSSL